ncbi:ABC-type bacteriocin/lantibiotic exporter with double-glycine peptidase domain [Deinobacterium chartae]|uniref:ABC-type bacteriocin/lantibiotic exporter with double-glycine peptidase domain n=1 Tax=Deinobacterium chartae TaxID=521158 RepID=A0A841I0J1_9DEIO|nr:C39 family peptidase [Deinobacterium chartae]MBB6097778.1 ABC-type bacteriocin/lantibiotic exporter with double-glycine peptidase domain [Deinobacterium chartae]
MRLVFLPALFLSLCLLGPAQAARQPSSAYLEGIAHTFQTYNNCGPASLVSVLGYYGYRVSQEEARKALRPQGGYMTADVIDPYLRPYGLRATRFKGGRLEDLKKLVSAGIPVLVLQWLDRVGGTPHFRVVRGYDDRAGVMWVSDSMYGAQAYLSYADFQTLWSVYGQEFIPIYPEGWQGRLEALLGVKGVARR